MLKTVPLLGVHVSRVDPALAVRQILEWVDKKQRTYVCIAPVATLVDAKRDPLYARAINGAGMVTPDGMPVVWLARRRGCKEVQRTYGPDLMRDVCRQGQEAGLRHFFYGAAPETLEKLRAKLLEAYPKINIAGMYSPPFTSRVAPESREVIDRINASGADIVWIGLGSPKQDFWMHLHRPLLTVPVMVASGAAFDFCAGTKPQAPRWMGACGLEWAFRLACEPKRLWKRYLIGNTLFLMHVIKDVLKKNVT